MNDLQKKQLDRVLSMEQEAKFSKIDAINRGWIFSDEQSRAWHTSINLSFTGTLEYLLSKIEETYLSEKNIRNERIAKKRIELGLPAYTGKY